MYVAPEARGNGYGRRLLEFVIQRAGTMPGLEQILLWVVPTNTAAHTLYQSLGFVTFGIERHAMKTEDGYADEAFMALFLHSTIAP
ncbi:MAG: Mycothiol acetyltransferase [Chlorobi bacterium OLB7]|nr:MAG: Mycothiol acetyltransferase [Chlorobi bacterium OLB7]